MTSSYSASPAPAVHIHLVLQVVAFTCRTGRLWRSEVVTRMSMHIYYQSASPTPQILSPACDDRLGCRALRLAEIICREEAAGLDLVTMVGGME